MFGVIPLIVRQTGNGGRGGDGGDAGTGGNGGEIELQVDEKDMDLLILLKAMPRFSGGYAGQAGAGGIGGSGGCGGPGGASYSWTGKSIGDLADSCSLCRDSETHTSVSYDSEGNSYTNYHTTHHSNPGGHSGYSGSNGPS